MYIPISVVVIDAVITGCTRNVTRSPRFNGFEPGVRITSVTLVTSLPVDGETVIGAISWTRQIADPLSISPLIGFHNVYRHVVDCKIQNTKLSCCRDSRSYCVRRYVMTNYAIGFGYKLRNGWYARSDSAGSLWTQPNSIYSSVTYWIIGSMNKLC